MATDLAQTKTDFGGYRPDDYEAQALGTINSERAMWDDENVFVTEQESYVMREVIKQARRYYSGIFRKRFDEVTGEKKIWVPMTEWSVESVVKSIDLDTKDVLITPNHPGSVNLTPIVRAAVLQLFKKINFGQLLNDFTRVMARDGTVVVKTYVANNEKTGKKEIRSEIVDLLNIWIDPTAKCIQEATVIERSPMTVAEVEAYRGAWDNLDNVVYSTNVARLGDIYQTQSALGRTAGESIPQTEIYERWGKIKKSWVTKDPKDDFTYIEGHIVASGIGGAQVIHVLRKNPRKDGIKPYEECQYRKIAGRWFGRGIPEMLFDLQEYANTIVNIRKANNLVLQNGIFLIRKGAGITPEMLSSINAGGGVLVSNIQNDVKQLQTQDFRQSSYTDEARIYDMADRVTASFDINRGEAGQASQSATATLTRDRNIRDTFVLVQENMGFFIEKLIMHHYIPLMQQTMKSNEDFVKLTGDAASLTYIDEQIVTKRVNDFIQKNIESTGFFPEPEVLQEYAQRQNSYLKSQGKQRFVKYFSEMFDADMEINVNITDEKFNRVVAVQQLRDALLAYSRLPVASKLDTDAILAEMFNIMGISGEFFLQAPQLPMHAMQPQGQTGRLLKAPAEGIPTELGAQQVAQGIPQLGQQAGGAAPQMGGQTAGAAPMQSFLNLRAQVGQPTPQI